MRGDPPSARRGRIGRGPGHRTSATVPTSSRRRLRHVKKGSVETSWKTRAERAVVNRHLPLDLAQGRRLGANRRMGLPPRACPFRSATMKTTHSATTTAIAPHVVARRRSLIIAAFAALPCPACTRRARGQPPSRRDRCGSSCPIRSASCGSSSARRCGGATSLRTSTRASRRPGRICGSWRRRCPRRTCPLVSRHRFDSDRNTRESQLNPTRQTRSP